MNRPQQEAIRQEKQTIPADQATILGERKPIPAERKTILSNYAGIPTERKTIPPNHAIIPAKLKTILPDEATVPAERKQIQRTASRYARRPSRFMQASRAITTERRGKRPEETRFVPLEFAIPVKQRVAPAQRSTVDARLGSIAPRQCTICS